MRSFFLLILLCIAATAAPVKPASKQEKLEVAGKVAEIFEAKCADCHGSHLPKPKGKFGYVLDIGRVGKNPEYVILGDFEKSEIYQMVKNNEMPGEDADVPPLTPEELKIVARWIEIGAPGELPPKPLAAAAPVAAAPQQPFGQRLLNWFGKFHAASTHFPVALLLIAVLAEAGAWWLRRPEWTLLVRFLVVIGALSSIPTATLGWLLPPIRDTSSLASVYNVHKWLGTATAVWAVVCAVLLCMNECAEGSPERRRFRGALLLGALLIAITGFLGGALVSGGLDHYKF